MQMLIPYFALFTMHGLYFYYFMAVFIMNYSTVPGQVLYHVTWFNKVSSLLPVGSKIL